MKKPLLFGISIVWVSIAIVLLISAFTPNSSHAEQNSEHHVSESGYTYSMLNSNKQTLYLEIRDALVEFDKVQLNSNDTDEIYEVFQCVLNDHPEIFYVDGFSYEIYRTGTGQEIYCFEGSYCFDKDDIQRKQEQIDSYVYTCLDGISANADDYEKVKYVYEYLIDHTEYDRLSVNNQNIYSVFVEGSSVCQGYAKATQYLLNKLEIPCTLILGSIEDIPHAWNIVKINGNYYHIDTTWGDASYKPVEDSNNYAQGNIPMINYDYLCVSTEQIEQTHKVDNVVPVPNCMSVQDNYYMREGLFLAEWDINDAGNIITSELSKGSNSVTIKCANYDVYKDMHEALVINKGIFDYIDYSSYAVSYLDNERDCSISFIF